MTNTLIPTNMPIRKPVYVGAGTNETTVHGEKFVPFSYDSMSGKMWMAGRELPTNVTVIYFEAGVHEFVQTPPHEFLARFREMEIAVGMGTNSISGLIDWNTLQDDRLNRLNNTKLDLPSVILVSGLMALVVVWTSFCVRSWMRSSAQKWNSAIDDVEEAK